MSQAGVCLQVTDVQLESVWTSEKSAVGHWDILYFKGRVGCAGPACLCTPVTWNLKTTSSHQLSVCCFLSASPMVPHLFPHMVGNHCVVSHLTTSASVERLAFLSPILIEKFQEMTLIVFSVLGYHSETVCIDCRHQLLDWGPQV